MTKFQVTRYVIRYIGVIKFLLRIILASGNVFSHDYTVTRNDNNTMDPHNSVFLDKYVAVCKIFAYINVSVHFGSYVSVKDT